MPLLTLALTEDTTRLFDDKKESMALSSEEQFNGTVDKGIRKWWWTIPVGLLVPVVVGVAYYTIRRKIMRSPPTRSNSTHGENQFAAWVPICESIGNCLVALWHLLTCGVTRRANRHDQDHQRGQAEAFDGPSDSVELQYVNGRAKRSDEEQQVAVDDDPERQSLASNEGQVGVLVPKSKGKSVWNKMMPFGRGNKTIASRGYFETGPSQSPRRQVEHTAASSRDRDQERRMDFSHVTEQLAQVSDVPPFEE